MDGRDGDAILSYVGGGREGYVLNFASGHDVGIILCLETNIFQVCELPDQTLYLGTYVKNINSNNIE